MARRLNTRKYILTGVLIGTCIYIYGIKFTARHYRERTNGISKTPIDTITIRPYKASLEATSADDVENLIHSWAENKVEENKAVAESAPNMQIPLPRVNQINTVSQNSPEKEENILFDESAASYSEVKLSSTHQPDGIKNFPPLKMVPLANDDNKTLELLDLWNFDEKCVDFQVGLLEDNTLERRALVSFPGSGNSWLRMLIQGVSGIFVDSVYPDGEDNLFHSKAKSTYQVPIDCGCTLLQKTHDFSLDATLFYLPEANRTHTINEFEEKGILILRNPFASIRSYRNFDSGGMQGMAPEAAFEGKKWDNFVARSVASWETLAQVWIRGLKQGGIIYYEKLRHEMPSELARLSKMLGLTYDQKRLDCVIRHAKDNSFKRDSVNKTKMDPYTASQRLLIHKAIEGVQAVLKERGLDPLPTQYYEFFSLLPEYGFLSNNTTHE